MKKRIILLIIVGLFLTGCTNQYNISINGDTISEELISTIPSSDIIVQSEEEKAAGIEADDLITPFIEEDQYPFTNNEKIKYKKTVSKNGNNTIVKLNYDYSIDDFKKSRVYNECFEKSILSREDGYIRLAFMGEFYCLYGDSININVTSDRKILDDTADDVNNNVYSWTINDSNQDNVNIQLILDDSINGSGGTVTTIIFAIVLILFIIIDIYIITNKKR